VSGHCSQQAVVVFNGVVVVGEADVHVTALRRCAITARSTFVTWPSALAAHSATSSMLACAAGSLLFSSAKLATRHGRPRSHGCNSRDNRAALTPRSRYSP
jgi:hypothetical protein